MKKVLVLVGLLLSVSGIVNAVEFNNPDYTYTQVWNAADNGMSYARWADYDANNGKVLWRDNSGNGYLADFDASTGVMSNQSTFAGAGSVYEASFSASGDYIFYQNVNDVSILNVNSNDLEGYGVYRYNVNSSATDKVFDLSTMPTSTIESLTGYAGSSEFGFYISQGGSDNEILMSFRATSGQMEIGKFSIDTQTIVNLTDSAQAEYDGQYFGTDTSKLLYWTESYPTHANRGIAILENGVETVIDSTTVPNMYLSARWGESQDQVMGTYGTGFGNTDLMMFNNESGAWSSPIDVTGDGWSYTDGGIYAGASTGEGVLFGVRSSTDELNGLWYAQAAATPIPAPGALLLAGIGTACVGRIRRCAL